MFIQTEETPNPETLKFLPGRVVLVEGTASFLSKESAHSCLLASKLLAIEGVHGVFFGSDFISITKKTTFEWLVLKPVLLARIMEYFLTHECVEIHREDSLSQDEDDPVVREIKELLESRIRPAVQQDGGDISFDRFEDGIVYVLMQGACSGCPSSTATLKSGIESMLRHYVPEVMEVRAA